MKNLMKFFKNEDGMGTVEVILIIVVLIGLVLLFKEKITSMLEKVLKNMESNIKKVEKY